MTAAAEDARRSPAPSRLPPDARSPIASRLVFGWVGPLLDRAASRTLAAEDLFDLHEKEAPRRSTAALEEALRRHGGRLGRALLSTAGPTIALALGLGLAHAASSVSLPGVLERFLQWLETPDAPVREGLLLTAALFLGSVCAWGLLHHCFFVLGKMTFRVRAALTGITFRKLLRAAPRARHGGSLGTVVNLVSNDVIRASTAIEDAALIVISLSIIVLAALLLYSLVGAASVAGILALAAMTPITNRLARALERVSSELAQKTDHRLGLLSDALRGIRALKLNGWEDVLLARVEEARRGELRLLDRKAFGLAALNVVFQTGPILVALVTFAVHAALGGALDVPIVMSTIAVLGILRPPLLFLPRLLMSVIEGRVALQRIEAFFAIEELAPAAPAVAPPGTVRLERADVSWAGAPVLRQIDLGLAPGELVAVVGAAGSGKTTLLTAIAGEATLLAGQREVSGRIAFAPQEPWVLGESIRDNVLCGAPLDDGRYKRVLAAAGLDVDVRDRPGGDTTAVADAGASLSGGQRQRVSFARAAYADAEVVLLDDPLSALDERLADQVFERAVLGEMAGRTRVLATTRLHYARRADRVVVLDGGAIVEQGRPDDLLRAGGAFARLDEIARATASAGPAEEVRAARGGVVSQDSASPASGHDGRAAPAPAGEDEEAAGDEERAAGAVPFDVYRDYLRSMGPLGFAAAVAVLFILRELLAVGGDAWLALRSGAAGTPARAVVEGYALFGALAAIATFARSLIVARGGVEAARRWHDRLLSGVAHAPFAFFDATPIGRVLNRFTRDQRAVDTAVVPAALDTLNVLFALASALAVVVVSSPYALLVLAPLLAVYLRVQRRFRLASREVARLDAVAQAPLLSSVEQVWVGLPCVRTLRREGHFDARFFARVEMAQRTAYAQLGLERWLSFNLDALGAVLLGTTALLTIALRGWGSLALGSLAVTYVLTITSSLQRAVHASAELEISMTALERVREFSRLAPEARGASAAETTWPMEGSVEFDRVELAYRDGIVPALRGVSFTARPGEKIGVVGRSGSGKSSLVAALLRTAPIQAGRILVEGVDIMSVPVDALRSRLTVVPQDPVLFGGTLRTNLDPRGQHDDEALWRALSSAGVRDALSAQGIGLDSDMGGHAARLGAGHRQLVCLARALLRGSRVVVLDEATASVDVESEGRLLDALDTALSDTTVIIIAHRLEALRGVDRVLIMDRGEVVKVVNAAGAAQAVLPALAPFVEGDA